MEVMVMVAIAADVVLPRSLNRTFLIQHYDARQAMEALEVLDEEGNSGQQRNTIQMF
jgi:hypothetical protein